MERKSIRAFASLGLAAVLAAGVATRPSVVHAQAEAPPEAAQPLAGSRPGHPLRRLAPGKGSQP